MGKASRKKRERLGLNEARTLEKVEQSVNAAIAAQSTSVWILVDTPEEFNELKQCVEGKRFKLPVHCGCAVTDDYLVIEVGHDAN